MRFSGAFEMPGPDGGGPGGPAGRLTQPTPDGGGPVGPNGVSAKFTVKGSLAH
jgi:hypothetical protein